jgi:hypothetical protein
MSSNGLKDLGRNLRTLKMIHEVGGSQLLEILKQLQNPVIWWPDTVG